MMTKKAESLQQINEAQKKAIRYGGGHLLIVAGPGTGKTHTLTHRIARLVVQLKEQQHILAVTFTRKAAEEMRQRLQSLCAGDCRRVFIGTFHEFCLKLLRIHGDFISLPRDFIVSDLKAVETLSHEIWPDVKAKDRREILERISLWKSCHFDQSPGEEAKAYQRKMRERKWLDFDDLLLEAWNLLQTQKAVRTGIQEQYPLICVDEYQDINRIQHELLKLLLGPQGTITAIGDPHQSIYGFRGADVSFFYRFKEDFPGAALMTLSENYRSAQNILSASGQVLARVRGAGVPALTARILKEGRLIIHHAASERAEAEYVVHQIEKMVGGTSMFSQDSGRVGSSEEGERSFGDIAVLYRLKSQARSLKEAFERMGMPYQMSGEEDENEEDILRDYYSVGEELELKAEKVSLMTLHAAKGLEFPVVFIIGCEEGLLPLNLEKMISDPEEERRLFYVGMTRAKERLFLLRAGRRRLYGKTYQFAPSPFLRDIEERLKEYEKVMIKTQRRRKDDEQFQLF